jgi:hypothetical protein
MHDKVITTTTMDCRRRMEQFLVFAGIAAAFYLLEENEIAREAVGHQQGGATGEL